MTTEMIERVARALAKSLHEPPDAWVHWQDEAQAAIEAMPPPGTPDQTGTTVDVRVGGEIVHTASTTMTARGNAGVNPVPDLLRMMADHIEQWCP